MIDETPRERRARIEADTYRRAALRDSLWVPTTERERRATTAAAVLDEEEFEFVDAEPEPRFGRPLSDRIDEGRVIVASAARVDVNDKRAVAAMRRRRQAWQTEAWDYSYEVPEAGATLDFVADLMSKLRLYPAIQPDAENDPIPVTSDEAKDAGVSDVEAKACVEALSRLRSKQGGQSVIIGDMAFNLAVAGECYLHGHEEPADEAAGLPVEEDWCVRSVDELVAQGDQVGIRKVIGSNQVVKVPDEDVLLRMWRRDRRFGEMAMAHMRRLLATCENLLLLDREVRSTSQSRLTNGFMLWPNGMSLGGVDPTRDDGRTNEDAFLDDLMDAQVTAVQEPGSAAAFAPINVQGPDEALEKVRHLPVSRPIDAVLDKRIEAYVLRVARGLPAPVEVTTGLQETTFANAAQVKDSEWDSYGEPMAVLIADAITAGFFQWMLVQSGMAPDRARQFFVWFDPSKCIAAPDPSEKADYAIENILIKGESWRRVNGYSEDDAPEPDEIMMRLLLKASARMDPFVQSQLLRDTGLAPDILIPAPSSGVIDTDTLEVSGKPAPPPMAIGPGPAPVAPVEGEGEEGDGPPAATAAAHPRATSGSALGRRLMEIDRDLRTRLRTAAEVAMRRVLERAGNKIKNQRGPEAAAARVVAATAPAPWMVAATVGKNVVRALGISDDALVEDGFRELAADFGAWMDVGYRQAIGEIERSLGAELEPGVRAQLLSDAERSATSAVDWLEEKLGRLAAERLYDPTPGAPVVGEVSGSIPEWIVRGAVAIGGGDTIEGGEGQALTSADGSPVGGIATGPVVLSATDGVEGWQWEYGSAPRTPFEPHEDLDGITFINFDDAVLANTEGWPSTDFYFPGDHDGCVCDVTPVIIVAPPGDEPEPE